MAPKMVKTLWMEISILKEEGFIAMREDLQEIADKLTPVFQIGDKVKNCLDKDSDTYIVANRHFCIEDEIIYYLDAEMNYCYPADELELVQRKESE